MVVIILIIIIIIILIIIFVCWGIRRKNCQNNENNENNLHIILKSPQTSKLSPLYNSKLSSPYNSNLSPYNKLSPYNSNLSPYNSNLSPYSSNLSPYNSNANNLLKISKIKDLTPNNIKYRGGIDNEISDINKSLNISNVFVDNGHPELKKNGSANSVFNKTDKFAPITHIKNQDHVDLLDFDEQNANQGLTRNDPYRPTNGTIQRIKMVAPYIKEEFEKEAQKEWWGNGEY
jgi:hypothetical protein